MRSLRFLSSVLLKLKQEFGEPLSILVTADETTDFETGAITTVNTEHKVKRAIEVPEGSGRKFAYDIAFLAANKNFTYGGNYDINSKVVLVHSRDLPKTYTPSLDNVINFRSKPYRITKIDELALNQGWIFTIKNVENTPL